MRFNCFWLKVLNISEVWILVTDEKQNSVVTLWVGDELHVTLDMVATILDLAFTAQSRPRGCCAKRRDPGALKLADGAPT